MASAGRPGVGEGVVVGRSVDRFPHVGSVQVGGDLRSLRIALLEVRAEVWLERRGSCAEALLEIVGVQICLFRG